MECHVTHSLGGGGQLSLQNWQVHPAKLDSKLLDNCQASNGLWNYWKALETLKAVNIQRTELFR